MCRICCIFEFFIYQENVFSIVSQISVLYQWFPHEMISICQPISVFEASSHKSHFSISVCSAQLFIRLTQKKLSAEKHYTLQHKARRTFNYYHCLQCQVRLQNSFSKSFKGWVILPTPKLLQRLPTNKSFHFIVLIFQVIRNLLAYWYRAKKF